MQRGFKIIKLEDRTIGHLYSTSVCVKAGREITLKHGGWVTMSTRKAINSTLESVGHSGRVFIRKGTMIYSDGQVELPIHNQLTVME